MPSTPPVQVQITLRQCHSWAVSKDTAGVMLLWGVFRYAGEGLSWLIRGSNRGRIARAAAAFAILWLYCGLHFWAETSSEARHWFRSLQGEP